MTIHTVWHFVLGLVDVFIVWCIFIATNALTRIADALERRP